MSEARRESWLDEHPGLTAIGLAALVLVLSIGLAVANPNSIFADIVGGLIGAFAALVIAAWEVLRGLGFAVYAFVALAWMLVVLGRSVADIQERVRHLKEGANYTHEHLYDKLLKLERDLADLRSVSKNGGV